MTLNLWRYYDWNARKENITQLVKEVQPDIVGLQEVQINKSFSSSPQSKNISEATGYKYQAFCPTIKKLKQIDKNGKFTQQAAHGLGLISKYPIISYEAHCLKQQPDDKEPRSVMFAKIKIDKKIIDICNVHFSNNDMFAELHLKELLEVCRDKCLHPIIIGDFNLYNLGKYRSNILSEYKTSFDYKQYTSYPKDNGTLDYILIPKTMNFRDVACSDTYVSDHLAVTASIDT